MNNTHRAYLEEMLSALFLVAGFVAVGAGYPTWAKVLWGKAALDLVCSLFFYVRGQYREEAANDA